MPSVTGVLSRLSEAIALRGKRIDVVMAPALRRKARRDVFSGFISIPSCWEKMQQQILTLSSHPAGQMESSIFVKYAVAAR